MRPQSTIGQQLTPNAPRGRYGKIESIGADTVYVLIDGGSDAKRMAFTGTPRMHDRVQVQDNDGVLMAVCATRETTTVIAATRAAASTTWDAALTDDAGVLLTDAVGNFLTEG